MTVLPFDGHRPELAPGAWVAPGATVIGAVRLAEDASLWYGAVARADTDRIEIGPGSNVQDGCVLHADPGFPALIGAGVSVGHRAVVHGCTVADDVLVGMGAVLLNGSHVGAGSLVAAGTVLLEGTRVPPGSLVAGVPGKVRRELTDEEAANIRRNAAHYRELARRHAQGE
ncbi:gamma carbonic anhydrase family protein [Streptomyces litchfieldiae]|uniref:Gamma carbonic anhydrase family protein n=1 Tax=Streptomyces litchfieldiae TaxID=3075543 RepID=A0ABU2ML38_9ACTN|nr:gamma carbonic anhydrase family protein [Streptomyces sp. DSM 44938]MDT0342320.1 gamma carbonic anhydrase family protein [Streptomyces sp. DSM 44938]